MVVVGLVVVVVVGLVVVVVVGLVVVVVVGLVVVVVVGLVVVVVVGLVGGRGSTAPWWWSSVVVVTAGTRPVGGRGRPLAMIPGAPPVSVVSVAVMAVVPFSAKVRVGPVPLRVKVVPAASGLTGTRTPSWAQLPLSRKNSISSGLPLFQK